MRRLMEAAVAEAAAAVLSRCATSGPSFGLSRRCHTHEYKLLFYSAETIGAIELSFMAAIVQTESPFNSLKSESIC